MKVNFVSSKLASEFYLLGSLAGMSNYSPDLASEYRKKRGNHPEDAQYVEQFRKIVDETQISSQRLMQEIHNSSLRQLLEIQATTVQNPDDLLGTLFSTLPPQDALSLQACFVHFEPLHDLLIWQPHHKQVEAYVAVLEKAKKEYQVNEKIEKIKKFFAVDSKTDINIKVVIVPSASGVHGSRAHTDESVQIIEIPSIGDQTSRLGVTVHETCHLFWSIEKTKITAMIAKAKATTGGGPAYLLLNEALATAIGNGWFVSQSDPDILTKTWYGDPYIDQYAHFLFPLVDMYLRTGRPLDVDLIKNAVGVFNKSYPDAKREPKIALQNVYLVTDEPDVVSQEYRQMLIEKGAQNIVTRMMVDSPPPPSEDDARIVIFVINAKKLDLLRHSYLSDLDVSRVKSSARDDSATTGWRTYRSTFIVTCVGSDRKAKKTALANLLKMKKIAWGY